MIERILPSQVTAAESFGDDPAAELFPQERLVIARATEKAEGIRYRARLCPAALARLAESAVAVLQGPASPAMAGRSNRQHHALRRLSRRSGRFDQGCRIAGTRCGA